MDILYCLCFLYVSIIVVGIISVAVVFIGDIKETRTLNRTARTLERKEQERAVRNGILEDIAVQSVLLDYAIDLQRKCEMFDKMREGAKRKVSIDKHITVPKGSDGNYKFPVMNKEKQCVEYVD